MNKEIKEIFEINELFNEWKTFLSWCYENNDKTVEIHRDKIEYVMNYITNLQKENKKLKDNQVRALNKIKDYISASKCEILEGNYSNDGHSRYWNLFNKQLKEIKKLIKGVNINQYINIPKYREKELLNKEEELEDYKQRNEKVSAFLKHLKNTFDESDEMYELLGSAIDILKGGDEQMDNIDEINSLHDYYIKQLQNQDDKMGTLYQELDQYKNNWEELKTYLNMVISMNFNMNNDKLSEQKVDDYTNILNKMKELEEDNNGD